MHSRGEGTMCSSFIRQFGKMQIERLIARGFLPRNGVKPSLRRTLLFYQPTSHSARIVTVFRRGAVPLLSTCSTPVLLG